MATVAVDATPAPNDSRERLLRLLDEQKLLQRELADLLGVSHQAVSLWVTGATTPYGRGFGPVIERVETLFKVGKTLASVEEMMALLRHLDTCADCMAVAVAALRAHPHHMNGSGGDV